MLYEDYLKTVKTCHFCAPVTVNKIIQKEELSFLTYSIAPYHKYHLLVVPTRHVENFRDLNEQETKSIDKLLHRAADILESLGHKNYTILVRNGECIGKSVSHLHYNIIPSVIIGDLAHPGEERKIITEEEVEQLIQKINSVI